MEQHGKIYDITHYDCFGETSGKWSETPQRLHWSPFFAIVASDENDKLQAWIECLYPLSPDEPYPFPQGQTKVEQDDKIREFRDRVLRWSDDATFNDIEVKAWVQEAWNRIKYAAENSSKLSVRELVGTYPEDNVEFGKTLTTPEQNMRQIKRQRMIQIVRRALLYKLFQDSPFKTSLESELAKIKAELELSKMRNNQQCSENRTDQSATPRKTSFYRPGAHFDRSSANMQKQNVFPQVPVQQPDLAAELAKIQTELEASKQKIEIADRQATSNKDGSEPECTATAKVSTLSVEGIDQTDSNEISFPKLLKGKPKKLYEFLSARSGEKISLLDVYNHYNDCHLTRQDKRLTKPLENRIRELKNKHGQNCTIEFLDGFVIFTVL